MSDNGDLAQKWLKMADEEFAIVEALSEAGVGLAGVCFHAQQGAEKSIKAWLIANDATRKRPTSWKNFFHFAFKSSRDSAKWWRIA